MSFIERVFYYENKKMLSEKAIKEFQEIYKREFNEEINEATARERAGRLLALIKVIYKNENQYEPRRQSN